MALYRLEAKILGRQAKDKTGKPIPNQQVSIVAKAAYRSGERLKDERTGQTFNYQSRSQEVVRSAILIPEGAPSWMATDRQKLWNSIEWAEKRKDSQLAREFIIALPIELDHDQQFAAVQAWCEVEIVSQGFVADIALHKSHDGSNPHCHILATLRPVEGEGFGLKPKTDGKFNGRGQAGRGAKSELVAWRASWEEFCNNALDQAGKEVRVDHRSLANQGLDRVPEPKIGVEATAMRRRGVIADPERVRLARRTRLDNYIAPIIAAVENTGETMQRWTSDTFDRSKMVFERMRGELDELMRDESSGGRPPSRSGPTPGTPIPGSRTWLEYVQTRRQAQPERGPSLEITN